MFSHPGSFPQFSKYILPYFKFLKKTVANRLPKKTLDFYKKATFLFYKNALLFAEFFAIVIAMRCPYCNSTDSRVADSRPDIGDAVIRRRRVCNQCGAKFTTVERVQMRDLVVIKNSGKTEAFDREKLFRSIKLACRNRDVKDDQIERLVASIQRRLETESADDTVTSVQVGQMVSDSLLNLDPIAFIRFVSVYRKFSKVSDFKKIINQIPEADDNAVVCKLPKTSLF